MASPQIEDGYTRIANEVLDHLIQAPLGGTEIRCVLAIIRQSWGWGKREAEIALKQFVEMTARDVDSVRQSLSNLQKKRIIAQVSPPAFDRAAVWMVEKNWELWEWGGVGKTPDSPIKNPDSHKIPTPQGGILPTPPSHKLPTPPTAKRPQRAQNQPTAAARKLQKENIKKSKEIKAESDDKASDARYRPLLDYFFTRYMETRGQKFFAVPADFKGLQGLLRRTRGQDDFSIKHIQEAMDRFLLSQDPFHKKQGKPLAYFCGNISAFRNGTARAAPDLHVGKTKSGQHGRDVREIYAKSIREKPVNKRTKEETEYLALYDSGAIDG